MSKLKLKYPEISIKLPQSGEEVTVRCLLTRDVDRLKHSFLSPVQSVLSLNEIIYQAIQNKPDYMMTYESYINNTTTVDRDSLIYAVYNITFGAEKTFDVLCPQCEKEQKLKVNLKDCYSFIPYPYSSNLISSYDVAKTVDEQTDEEMEKVKEEIEKNKKLNIITRVEKVNLEYAEDAVAYIKQPTIADEINTIKRMVFAEDTHINELLKSIFVSKFEGKDENDNDVVVDTPEEVLEIFNSLLIKDRKLLEDKYEEIFGQYRSETKTAWKCSNCKYDGILEIDVATQFFRMVQTS